MTLLELHQVYAGSDGDATKALYERLARLGAAGELAVNLFRATKNSARAKVYRGGIPGRGSYKRMAYDRKNWALENLCRGLDAHAAALGFRWGWKLDPDQAYHAWVLYVDLPTGQCSWHSASRLAGPDYPGEFDGRLGLTVQRMLTWIASL